MNPNINPGAVYYSPTPQSGQLSLGSNVYANQPADTTVAGTGGYQTNPTATAPTAPAAPKTDAYGNTVGTYDQNISALQGNLASTLAGLTGAQKVANNSYDTAVASNTLGHNRNQQGYDTQQTDTTNAEQKALGTVDTNTRTLSDSLRRIIGMAGGANSSAYQLAAPQAAARQGTQQRTNTLDSYGTNLRALDTARGNENTDFQTLLTNLGVQKQKSLQDAQQSTNQNLISTNGSLADNAARRAALLGSDPNAARQPYMNEISTRQAALDQMLANPIATQPVNPLVAATPNLSAYNVDKGTLNANTQAGTSNPYAYFLQPKKQDASTAPIGVA